MSSLDCLQPTEFAFITFVLAVVIAENLDINEQNSIGNFFQALGQEILLINAQQQLLVNAQDDSSVCQELESLKKQIEILEKKVQK